MKPVIENEKKRTKVKQKRWVDMIAEQFGGMLGDTTGKVKKRKEKLKDI